MSRKNVSEEPKSGKDVRAKRKPKKTSGIELQIDMGETLIFSADGIEPDSIDEMTFTVRSTEKPNASGSTTVTIVPAHSVLDHFEVAFEHDTIAFSEDSKIFVTAKDENGYEFPLDGSTLINFSIHTQDEKFGDLSNGIQQGKFLYDIPYSIAKQGLVYYIAQGDKPDSIVQVRLSVTGADKEGVGFISVIIDNL